MKNTIRLLPLLILLWSAQAFGQGTPLPSVESVKFESKLIGASLPYNVVLPSDYSAPESKETHYPVLFLLHGLSGSAGDWVSNRAHLAEHASRYRIIVVTPEGKDSWYTDSATVPTARFESYVIQELLPEVESRFRTIRSREGRAIAGLSMGGYGALKFGLKYPDKFAFAASMSGALNAPSFDQNDAKMPEWVKPSIGRAYGDMGSAVRRSNDIFKLVETISEDKKKALPFFYLDCGTEDMLIDGNRVFSGLLLKQKIAHEFRELPGEHSWPYWDQQVQEILKLVSGKLAPAQTARTAAAQ